MGSCKANIRFLLNTTLTKCMYLNLYQNLSHICICSQNLSHTTHVLVLEIYHIQHMYLFSKSITYNTNLFLTDYGVSIKNHAPCILAISTTCMKADGSSALMYESTASFTIPLFSWAPASWLHTAGSLQRSANSYARSRFPMCSIST